MFLKEWDWDQQTYVEVEYPDAPIKAFMDYLWEGKQWRERPELALNKFRQLQEQLVEHRNRQRLAVVTPQSSLPGAPPAGHVCPTCNKVVKTPLALAGHMRSHEKKTAGAAA